MVYLVVIILWILLFGNIVDVLLKLLTAAWLTNRWRLSFDNSCRLRFAYAFVVFSVLFLLFRDNRFFYERGLLAIRSTLLLYPGSVPAIVVVKLLNSPYTHRRRSFRENTEQYQRIFQSYTLVSIEEKYNKFRISSYSENKNFFF